jgi:ATP-dependent RNA helicase RhlE
VKRRTARRGVPDVTLRVTKFPSIRTGARGTTAPPTHPWYDFENVFDWRSGPRRGSSVKMTAPIPTNHCPDRAPHRAGGPRQEHLLSFSALGLAPELLRAVEAQGYTDPTPVQREAIPLVLAGRDLLAGAQTGTGKTAAFVLPILQRLNATRAQTSNGNGRSRIRALILVPTRELAIQVEESVRAYGGRGPNAPRSTTIYGGVGFPNQVNNLRRGPEIVVATPGRLLDHSRQRTIDLSGVEVLVLDEADRMLDMGFIRDIRAVIALLPARRQNLLFSATFSKEIRALAEGMMHEPASVQVTPPNTAIDLVKQVVHPVDRSRKRELLSHLVRTRAVDQALVFTRTKHGANKLAEQLWQDGIATAAIHGNKSQPQRVKALNDFKAGRVTLLIATEVAARGIDIEELPHVVNFELPMVPADYLHRIGRTGRAGIEGDAISLVCVDEAPLLRDIERLLGNPVPTVVVDGFEPDRSIRAEPIKLRSGQGGGGRPGPQRGPRHATRSSAPQPHAAPQRWSSRPGRRTQPSGRTAGSSIGNRAGGAQWTRLPGERSGR